LSSPIEIPQLDLVIQTARRNPVIVEARRSYALDIVGVETDGLGRYDVLGSGPPYLDCDI
jgi:hypothetical protein